MARVVSQRTTRQNKELVRATARKRANVGVRTNFYDYSLVFIIIFLCCFGLVMLYSTASYSDEIAHAGDSFYTVKKQGIITLGAFVLMIIVSKIDYHIWASLAKYAYVLSLVLGVLVLFVGHKVKGKRRWFRFGGLSFQPAEFAKIALILTLAVLINYLYPLLIKYRTLVILGVVTGVIALPVAAANLSSGIIIAGIGVVMVFVATRQKAIYAAALVIVSGLAYCAVHFEWLHGYQLNRIMAWLDPLAYQSNESFQIVQGLYAIGSGGVFGRGLGSSIQKLGYLPEAQNDMIFGIICEELGLFGAGLVIILFVMMIWRFMIIANSAEDLVGSMIVVGVMAHIAIQVFLNIAVVTNTIPNTGVSLPFISYGGTSVLFLLIEMGIVLNVASRIKMR